MNHPRRPPLDAPSFGCGAAAMSRAARADGVEQRRAIRRHSAVIFRWHKNLLDGLVETVCGCCPFFFLFWSATHDVSSNTGCGDDAAWFFFSFWCPFRKLCSLCLRLDRCYDALNLGASPRVFNMCLPSFCPLSSLGGFSTWIFPCFPILGGYHKHVNRHLRGDKTISRSPVSAVCRL